MKKKGTLKLLSCLLGLFMTAGVVATTVDYTPVSVNATETTVTTPADSDGSRWWTTNGKGTFNTYSTTPAKYSEVSQQKGLWLDYTPAIGEESASFTLNYSMMLLNRAQFYAHSVGSAGALVQTLNHHAKGFYSDATYLGHSISIIYMKRPDGNVYATLSLTEDLEFDYENGYAYIAGTNQKTIGLSDSKKGTIGSTYSTEGLNITETLGNEALDGVSYSIALNPVNGGIGVYISHVSPTDTTKILCLGVIGTDAFKTAATSALTSETNPAHLKYKNVYNRVNADVVTQMGKNNNYETGSTQQTVSFSVHGMKDTKDVAIVAVGCDNLTGWPFNNFALNEDYAGSTYDKQFGGPTQMQLTKTLEVGKSYTFDQLIARGAVQRVTSGTTTPITTYDNNGDDISVSKYGFGEYTGNYSTEDLNEIRLTYWNSTSNKYLSTVKTDTATTDEAVFTITEDDIGKTYYILSTAVKYEGYESKTNNNYHCHGCADFFFFTVPEISYADKEGAEVKASLTTDNGKVTLGAPTAEAPAGKAFIGWKKQTEGIYADRLYSANSVVVPTQNETYVAQYADFTRLAGAEIRLANPNGIRWVAEFDKKQFDALAGSGLNYSYGATITSENSDKQVDIVGDKDKLIAGESVYTMYFALTDIKEANYTRKYFIAPYVTFTYFDGTTMTVTAGLAADATQDWSTYQGIVNAAYEDLADEKDAEYVYEVEIDGATKYTKLNPTLWANLVEVYKAVNAQ